MRLAAIGCQSWVQYRRFLPRGRRPLFKRDLKGRLLGGQSGRQGRRYWKLLKERKRHIENKGVRTISGSYSKEKEGK